MESSTTTTTTTTTKDDEEEEETDPYLFLEDVEGDKAMEYVLDANQRSLAALGDPKESPTYERVLAFLESNDRIPYVRRYGQDQETGETILFNFWKDAKNPKGLWRRTTLDSYSSSEDGPIEWTTVVDVDALAKEDGISWVWKGPTVLPRSRDGLTQQQQYKRNTLAMLSLSRGGSDATVLKEFDLLTESFLTGPEAFFIPEAKTRASYKSRNVLLVGTDTGPGSMTDSGYARTVREWVRGTKLEDAPVVFEGEQTDVSAGMYIDDERSRGGDLYEVQYRSVTFYTSKHWIRKIDYHHLLAPNEREDGVDDPPDFQPVDIQDDANFSMIGKMIFISLRSDWQPKPDGPTYLKGSVVYTNAESFLSNGKEACEYQVLFAPTARTALEYYSCTKNYLVLISMDNVKSRMDFYKIEDNGASLRRVGKEDTKAQIRSCSVSAVDAYESDEFWFTTSTFTQPSTLYLADAARVEDTTTDGDDNNDDDVFIVKPLKSLPPQFDASGLEVHQEFAKSKDGTEIPYFMIKRQDTELNGKNPTLVYGYGGFEVSLGPRYVGTPGLAWLEKGGVYIEANIRGGGEFGPSWHQAALKANRNKSYEDFIAVCEDVIAKDICSPATLAIRGGSNGGLLMGNMYTMRPDLFGAIHCAVPLLDMKRYHKLLAGASWMGEYGDPDTDDWKNFLYKYSAYQNIDGSNSKYPPMLVTTSTRDDRVHPGHARKFVKKVEDLGKDKDWPIYYYENIEGEYKQGYLCHRGGGEGRTRRSSLDKHKLVSDTLSSSVTALILTFQCASLLWIHETVFFSCWLCAGLCVCFWMNVQEDMAVQPMLSSRHS